jgi:hypothetical protein
MIYYKELNNFYELLETEAINNNGIIYGTYPCEKLLAIYNRSLYYIDNNLSSDKFYDIEYDKKTIDRFIKSTNIKIAFKHGIEHINFYSFITNNINTINDLNISIEITISNDEPPYSANNYTCYGLLLSKQNNTPMFYYSKNTGTSYDLMENPTKSILKDIIQKRTSYIRGHNENYKIFTDIYKMIDNGWKINNLPYSVYNDDQNEKCCPICLDKLNISEIACLYEYKNLSSNSYEIHHNCLVKFLTTQKNKEYFICPYRYKIDFKQCHLSMIL